MYIHIFYAQHVHVFDEWRNVKPSDMLTSDDRKEVDLHLAAYFTTLELVIFKICHNSMMLGGGGSCLN